MKHSYFVIFLLLTTLVSNSFCQTTFSDLSPTLGIAHFHKSNDMGGGVALFDYNQDSLLDIFYTGGEQRATLYRNNGNGTFTDVSVAAGLGFTDSVTAIMVTTGDIDNDGYREIFLGTEPEEPNYLLKNNGNGTFTDITALAGIAADSAWAMSAMFGDYDRDGYLDLYIGNYVEDTDIVIDSMGTVDVRHTCTANVLFRNNGNGTFTDVTQTVMVGDTGCTLAVTFTDYDTDGDADIYNANDFGQWLQPNVLYQNTLSTSMVDIAPAANIDAGIFGMGIAIGDYDQDLDLDYYVTNIGRNILHRNNGNGTFTDTTNAAGVGDQWVIQDSLQATGWGTGFMDIDNDSYLDLYVANGQINAIPQFMTSRVDPDKLFLNNGDGTFSDISASLEIDSLATTRGFAYGDIDNDGDIDLFPVTSLVESGHDTLVMPILQNNLNNTNNWLQVSLEGTISNRDAYGTLLYIYLNGKAWVQEVNGGGSHCSQHSTIAHFGLGNATVVDSLVIHWPNGLIEKQSNIAINQRLHLVEGIITNLQEINPQPLEWIVFPNPAHTQINVRYQTIIDDNQSTLELINALGQIVWQQKIANNLQLQQQNIAVSHLEAGIYFVRLHTKQQVQTQKIIIQH